MFAIPPKPLSLCEALALLTQATWCEMGVGISSWQRLAEESITDFNLMRLASAVPELIIEKHGKHREADTGADWELWIGGPGAYVGFRIQAKILNPDSAKYEALYRTLATATEQANDLIISALSGRWPTYPLYSFYCHRLPTGTGPTISPCPRVGPEADAHGWTIASALRVADVLRSNPTKAAAAFDSFCYPIPCLFCCPESCGKYVAAQDSVASTVFSRAAELFSIAPTDQLPNLIHEIAPVYVERMFKGERPDDGWAENGLPTPASRFIPEDLSRVVLIRDLSRAA